MILFVTNTATSHLDRFLSISDTEPADHYLGEIILSIQEGNGPIGYVILRWFFRMSYVVGRDNRILSTVLVTHQQYIFERGIQSVVSITHDVSKILQTQAIVGIKGLYHNIETSLPLPVNEARSNQLSFICGRGNNQV
ncbi:hypothetical protein BMS3Bbin04_01606 [bacterium BMS3Bbin04]|nr:hypothetical protein BMS3Bbin04_01606 [bacterium BMS3Bbin04]